MVISRAPSRISFFGGGTDYPEYFLQHGGAVLSTAIDKFSYVTASPFYSRLFDYAVRIQYRQVESVKAVAEIEHRVFRECLKWCHLEKDIEIHTAADLPSLSGLGSSSTFLVALLHVLHAFKGEFVRPMELAYEAIEIERHKLQDNVGCQDQVAAAVGGFNLIEFRSEHDILAHSVPISPQRLEAFQQHFFMVYTGITRKASDVVASQLRQVHANLDTLREMRAMVTEGWDILTSNRSLTEFGLLLNRAWQAKRSLDAGISNPVIDAMYQHGLDAGALGGKLLGAGGGGFILFFAPPEKIPALTATFVVHQSVNIRFNAPGSEIIFAS